MFWCVNYLLLKSYECCSVFLKQLSYLSTNILFIFTFGCATPTVILYRSVMTGTLSPAHHTKWADELDDSLEAYLGAATDTKTTD